MDEKNQVKVQEMGINFDMKTILDDDFVSKVEEKFGAIEPIMMGFNLKKDVDYSNLMIITHSSIDNLKEKKVDVEAIDEDNLFDFVDLLKSL